MCLCDRDVCSIAQDSINGGWWNLGVDEGFGYGNFSQKVDIEFSKGHYGFTWKMIFKLWRERVQFIAKGVDGWMGWIRLKGEVRIGLGLLEGWRFINLINLFN